MACWKCSAELHGAKKFCGQCGAAVAAPGVDPFASTVQPNARPQAPVAPVAPGSAPGSSVASPGSSIGSPSVGAASVGAASVGAPSVGAPSVGTPRSRVSPLASSAMEFSSAVRELVVAADAQAAVVAAPAGTLQMQQVPPRPAPVPPAPAAVAKPPSVAPPPAAAAPVDPLGPGAAVRVRWSNGQKYPGTVWQVHGTQVLVAFGDGQRHWVEASFVERA